MAQPFVTIMTRSTILSNLSFEDPQENEKCRALLFLGTCTLEGDSGRYTVVRGGDFRR